MTPCGHNFCLKCFQKWVGQGRRTCVQCRSDIPQKMASHPRINDSLVFAIRMARASKPDKPHCQQTLYHFIRNEDRPEQAYTTERAKKSGKANACSGQIFVSIPPDHFGPIPPVYDTKFGEGVYVGRTWEDRMECRQWGAHFPHVAGIAGQSDYGAQSVVLSGGYEDDEDHGEWFLYTGSGGRDLNGNKRTNKEQAFDQKFEKLNEALRVSCRKGYPVRVVRSHKEKRSSYAPQVGLRYDGIYRIEKCWRKIGIQGFKVCRYLFVRCDNDPAPWTSDEHGDHPRLLPEIKELKRATDITERKENSSWDYAEEMGWRWTRPSPMSRKPMPTQVMEDGKPVKRIRRHAQFTTVRERLLKEFSCLICRNVMKLPLTTPCAHNFCKSCLLGAFGDQKFVRERTREGGRTLRAQRIVKKCPCCPNDISEFLQNPQVNRELMDLIESLRQENEQKIGEDSSEGSDVVEKSSEGSDNVENKMSIGDGSDGMKTETSHEESNGVKQLNGEGSDGIDVKEPKTVIDDSKTVGQKEVVKNGKKLAERSNALADKSNGDKIDGIEDKTVDAVCGDSEKNAVNFEEEGLENESQTLQVNNIVLSSYKRKKPAGIIRSGVSTRSKK